MTPEDARLVLRALVVGRVAHRLLNAGRLDELTVLARMSDVELDVVAHLEHVEQQQRVPMSSTGNPQSVPLAPRGRRQRRSVVKGEAA